MPPKGYDPLNIDFKLIPKRWLDNPMMDFEDARKEAEAIQNAEIINDVNQQKLQDITDDNEYKQKVKDRVEEQQVINEANGEDRNLTSDQLFAIADEVGVATGQTKEVIDRNLRRTEADANRALAEKKMNQPKIRGITQEGGIVEYDPNNPSAMTIIKEPKDRQPAPDKAKVIMMVNPDNGEVAKVDADNPVALAGAIGAGYKMKFDDYLGDLNNPYSDLNLSKGKTAEKSPGGDAPPKAPMKARPGYKIQRNPKTGEEREVPIG